MILDCEFTYSAKTYHRNATHRIRLFGPCFTEDSDLRMTLIATDLSDRYEFDPSVTNSIEHLVTAFLKEHPEISYPWLKVIEHYDDREWNERHFGQRKPLRPEGAEESFDAVTFDWNMDSGELSRPQWSRLTKKQVEELVGEKLP